MHAHTVIIVSHGGFSQETSSPLRLESWQALCAAQVLCAAHHCYREETDFLAFQSCFDLQQYNIPPTVDTDGTPTPGSVLPINKKTTAPHRSIAPPNYLPTGARNKLIVHCPLLQSTHCRLQPLYRGITFPFFSRPTFLRRGSPPASFWDHTAHRSKKFGQVEYNTAPMLTRRELMHAVRRLNIFWLCPNVKGFTRADMYAVP